MPFNSLGFLFVILPSIWSIHALLKKIGLNRVGRAWLLCSSLVFYGLWNIWYVPLLVGSLTINYLLVSFLSVPRSDLDHSREPTSCTCRKVVLWGSVIFNVMFLGYLKYTNFLIANVNGVLGCHLPQLRILLPVGISLYLHSNCLHCRQLERPRGTLWVLGVRSICRIFSPCLERTDFASSRNPSAVQVEFHRTFDGASARRRHLHISDWSL